MSQLAHLLFFLAFSIFTFTFSIIVSTEFDFGTLTFASPKLLGDAFLNNDTTTLTCDLIVPFSGAGQALHSHSIRFWKLGTTTPASFTTFFSFSITNLTPSSIGAGLAFVISTMTLGDAGGYLGLARSMLSLWLGKDRFLNLCDPIREHALNGNWPAAKRILEKENKLINAAIEYGRPTLLHVAAGANQIHFVKQLLKLLDDNDLELQDNNGNTAFCIAAAAGNIKIVDLLFDRNSRLSVIRSGNGYTPIQYAAFQGRCKMTWYLYDKTKHCFEDKDWKLLFFACIDTGIYDLALEMLKQNDTLATARGGDSNETGLHLLARKHSVSGCQRLGLRKILLQLCTRDSAMLKLIRHIWDKFLTLDDEEMMEVMREPSQVTIIAAEVGNFEFLSVIMSTYPNLLWELSNKGQSIIHIAVSNRHASIFNLIHEIGFVKDCKISFLDDGNNNLLHSAAMLAPPDRLNIVSGAALQMMLELSWFEEVKKIMLPNMIEMKNSEGMTPRELFTKEHAELLKKGESWMKQTASSCMVCPTLVAAGVFSAAFSLPGGNNDNTKSPNYLDKPSFLIFALSNSLAIVSSSTSILTFLSILTSRYKEQDFLKSLPLKLIIGLVALFISLMSMMVAFSSAFFIAYYHGLKWVPLFISALVFLLIPLFIYLQFSLWSDIVYSAYFRSSLFRPGKRMIG